QPSFSPFIIKKTIFHTEKNRLQFDTITYNKIHREKLLKKERREIDRNLFHNIPEILFQFIFCYILAIRSPFHVQT
ncbi:MAG: hypothetical protein FWD60_14030, partial [Candidatus Azobacteroides sp.]|nr:hypothetical protein [Candidatus Azobacteroides sp.]